MRHHDFLELNFEPERFQFRRDIIDRLLRLSRTAQARPDVVREMRDLAIRVIARERGLLELLQLGQSLRRQKRRRRSWRRRNFLGGGYRNESRSEDEMDRDRSFSVWFHKSSWLFFWRAV